MRRRRRGRRRRTGEEMQAIAEGHSQEANFRAASEAPHIRNDPGTSTYTCRCADIKQAVKEGAGLPKIQPKGLAEMSVNSIEREEDRLEDAAKKRECVDVAGDTTRDSPEDWYIDPRDADLGLFLPRRRRRQALRAPRWTP
jgi:hypothetical protein